MICCCCIYRGNVYIHSYITNTYIGRNDYTSIYKMCRLLLLYHIYIYACLIWLLSSLLILLLALLLLFYSYEYRIMYESIYYTRIHILYILYVEEHRILPILPTVCYRRFAAVHMYIRWYVYMYKYICECLCINLKNTRALMYTYVCELSLAVLPGFGSYSISTVRARSHMNQIYTYIQYIAYKYIILYEWQ